MAGSRGAAGVGTVALTPPLRGAPGAVRGPLEALLATSTRLRVASQQVADRGVVDAMAGVRSQRGGAARVLVEADYLAERQPHAPSDVWTAGGEREEHRQCFLALTRAGLDVRADHLGSALQHVNLVVASGDSGAPDGGEDAVYLTSANFAPDSIDRHLNWGLELRDRQAAQAVADVFDAAWDGDFRDAHLDHRVEAAGGPAVHLVAGGLGQAVEKAAALIDSAQQRVRFAYFALSDAGRVTERLAAAAARGVDVAGIVDGDQGHQAWDGVPTLRAAGAAVGYYPGVRTGAIGRMHHKTLVVDQQAAHLSTANASHAAESSFELGVTLWSRNAAAAVEAELARLGRNATTSRPVPL